MNNKKINKKANEGNKQRCGLANRQMQIEAIQRLIEKEEDEISSMERDMLLYIALHELGCDTPRRRKIYKRFFGRIEKLTTD
jgi:hypothetical protein